MTFSPCCKWVLVECEGRGLAEGGERLGRGWGVISVVKMAVAVKEGPDCIGTARRREQPVQPNQSRTGQEKKVLLSASNDPLDNHTGTKRLYLTLIANPGPPISELHDSPALPCHLPAQRREPSLNGIYNHPSSVSTLIVILRLELCIKHLARLKWRP